MKNVKLLLGLIALLPPGLMAQTHPDLSVSTVNITSSANMSNQAQVFMGDDDENPIQVMRMNSDNELHIGNELETATQKATVNTDMDMFFWISSTAGTRAGIILDALGSGTGVLRPTAASSIALGRETDPWSGADITDTLKLVDPTGATKAFLAMQHNSDLSTASVKLTGFDGDGGVNYNIHFPAAAPAVDQLLATTSATSDQLEWRDVGGLGAAIHPVTDTTAVTKGSVDATKLFRIENDTNIATGTTVVGTVPGGGNFTFAGLELAQTWTADNIFGGGANALCVNSCIGGATDGGFELLSNTSGLMGLRITGGLNADENLLHVWNNNADGLAVDANGRLVALGTVDPLNDTHIGDRGYNDGRYAETGAAETITADYLFNSGVESVCIGAACVSGATSAYLEVEVGAAGQQGVRIKGDAAQNQALLLIEDSAANSLLTLSSGGSLQLNGAATTNATLEVQATFNAEGADFRAASGQLNQLVRFIDGGSNVVSGVNLNARLFSNEIVSFEAPGGETALEINTAGITGIAAVEIKPAQASDKGLSIQAFTGQTADLFETVDSAGGLGFVVDSSGFANSERYVAGGSSYSADGTFALTDQSNNTMLNFSTTTDDRGEIEVFDDDSDVVVLIQGDDDGVGGDIVQLFNPTGLNALVKLGAVDGGTDGSISVLSTDGGAGAIQMRGEGDDFERGLWVGSDHVLSEFLLTLQERASNPTTANGTEATLYVKSNQIVFTFNNGTQQYCVMDPGTAGGFACSSTAP